MGDDAVGETAISIARSKASLTLMEAFSRGILCNVFVCLAVRLATGAGNIVGGTLLVASVYWVA